MPHPTNDTPDPGSDAAQEMGCTCPPGVNRRGLGMFTDIRGETMFMMVADCPVHGVAPTPTADAPERKIHE